MVSIISKGTSFWCWKSSMATMGFTLRRLSSDDYIHSFPPSPSLRGKLKMNRVEGGRKNPEEKAAFYGMEGGAAGKWLGLGPLKQEEVSLPRRPPPSGLLSGCWRQFCSPWHSFPLESRSGPPSPEGLSETSFSVPLTPVGVNIYRKSRGTLKAQKPKRRHCISWRQITSPVLKSGPKDVVTAPHQILYQQREEGGLEWHVGKDLSISMAWDQEWVQMFTEGWECGQTLHYLSCLRCELSKGEKTDLKDPLSCRNSSDLCPVFYKPMEAEPRTLRNTLSGRFCKGILLIHIILLDIIYVSQHHKKWTVTTTQTNNLFP